MDGELGTSARIACEDGTEIPFSWVYPGAEDHEWMRDKAHWPLPTQPMAKWLRLRSWAGADLAFSEVGMEAPATFYRFQFVGPFLYLRVSPWAPERTAALSNRYRDVAKQYGGAAAFWQRHGQPRIERVCRELAGASNDVPLETVAERSGYGFHQTFTASSLLIEASMRLTAIVGEYIEGDPSLVMFELTQGGNNASQAVDAEVWELANIARQSAGVTRLLSGDTGDVLAALRREPVAATFMEGFDALIDRHGARSLGWSLDLPTWREQPEAVVSLVRSQLASDPVSPAGLHARSVALREAATARAIKAIPAARHEEFRSVIRELDGYVGVREGRAYWQMTLTGEMRELLLRRGAALVQLGQLHTADDILFVTPEDLAGSSGAGLRDVVVRRRKEWEGWKRIEPPLTIGTPSDSPYIAAPQVTEPGVAQLRGRPASRGVVTGPARIIERPEDASRVRNGDVLVCVMTTPAWTPMFAVAAGIVTETGGALSHPAITAREYGVPAVVAVHSATTRIRDGQMVTIDGGAGLVSLHE
jgi:pyruvate,water dikinase